jgi:hypothetical protein
MLMIDPWAALMIQYCCGLMALRLVGSAVGYRFVRDGIRNLARPWRAAYFAVVAALVVHFADGASTAQAMALGASEANLLAAPQIAAWGIWPTVVAGVPLTLVAPLLCVAEPVTRDEKRMHLAVWIGFWILLVVRVAVVVNNFAIAARLAG